MLDTLEDLRVDPYLMSSIAFQSVGQETVRGYTVRVRVRSARGLPVAFRLPYSVEWAATADNDSPLPPLRDGELLFPARRVAEDILFTLPEDVNILGRTIEVRLGELSRIRLSRSDGTGPRRSPPECRLPAEPPRRGRRPYRHHCRRRSGRRLRPHTAGAGRAGGGGRGGTGGI